MTTINTPEELLRALRENPEWREAVRAEILGEELLRLPVEFHAFVERVTASIERLEASNSRLEASVSALESSNSKIQASIAALEASVAALQKSVTALEAFAEEMKAFVAEMKEFVVRQEQFNRNTVARFDRMEGDISSLKDFYASSRASRRAELIAIDLGMEFVRELTLGDLARIAVQIAGGNRLTDDLKSFREADLVFEASNQGQTTYLAVECSYTGAPRDSGRAIRNATYLAQVTGCPTVAVVSSVRNTREVEELIESGAVYWDQLPEHVLDRQA